jgi:hypothetical protein
MIPMTNRNSSLAAATVLISLASGAALAADGDVTSRGPVPFEVFDHNGDGYVDEQEFDRVRSERIQQRASDGRMMRNMGNAPAFTDLDSDGDGRVSRQEHQAHQRQRQQMRWGNAPDADR